MIRTTCAFLLLAPAVLSSQAGSVRASGLSVGVRSELTIARRRGLPEEPILRWVDVTRVKGGSEAQQASAARRARMTMEAGVDAMAQGGHGRPTDVEIERCAAALDQGYTRSQVATVAGSAPAERSLAVAFDVLTQLSRRGLPVSRALEQVTQKLQKGESDESLMAMLTSGVARRP